MNDKRQKIETLIDKVMRAMDPSGVNANKYKQMFSVMSDQQFSQWITKFLADPKSNFRIDIEEFGSDDRKLLFENMEKAADIVNIKLFEYVYMPHLSSDPNRPVRTSKPVLVGYLNIKRPQQMVMKKTGLALSDDNRDENTGAVKGESKAVPLQVLRTNCLLALVQMRFSLKSPVHAVTTLPSTIICWMRFLPMVPSVWKISKLAYTINPHCFRQICS